MGTIFDEPTISGYNANPPPDDGTASSDNEIEWSKHKSKLGDPVKTLAETTVTNITTALAKLVGGGGITESAVDYTALEADQGKLVAITAADKTLTTPDATVVGAPFVFGFVNISSGDMTLDPSGTQTLNGSASSVTVPAGRGGWLFTDGTNWFAPGLNFRSPPQIPQGRLTLTTGVPVLTSDVASATIVYFTPYQGNSIILSDGTTLEASSFSELSLTLNTNHLLDKIYDVFVWNDSGTKRLVTGPAWNTSTAGSGARGTGAGTTELTLLDGFYVNNVAMTARNGATTYSVGASEALYVGSMLIDGTAGQVTCHTSYGQTRRWGVWNAFNRRPVFLKAGEASSNWAYNTTTIRQSNAGTGNMVKVFSGLPEENIKVSFSQRIECNASEGQIGIGVNTTNAISGMSGWIEGSSGVNDESTPTARHIIAPTIGLNDVNSLENDPAAAGTTTFFGGETEMLLLAEWLG